LAKKRKRRKPDAANGTAQDIKIVGLHCLSAEENEARVFSAKKPKKSLIFRKVLPLINA
jgi:hypothetical protein